MRHGSSPDERLLRFHKQSHRDELQATGFLRNHPITDGFRRKIQSQHNRSRRPIDVAIQQANSRTRRCERSCDIDSHRGFADSAFAAAHGNDVPDALQRGFIICGIDLTSLVILISQRCPRPANPFTRATAWVPHLVFNWTCRGRQIEIE